MSKNSVLEGAVAARYPSAGHGGGNTTAFSRAMMIVLGIMAAFVMSLTSVGLPHAVAQETSAQETSAPATGAIEVGELDQDLIEDLCKGDGDKDMSEADCAKKLEDKYKDKFDSDECKGKSKTECVETLLKKQKDDEEKSKAENSQAKEDDYSLYRLSSANTGLLFDALGMSASTSGDAGEDSNDDADSDADSKDGDTAPEPSGEATTEASSGMPADWANQLAKPANAGAFLGFCDKAATPGVCTQYYGSLTTKASTSYSYDTFEQFANAAANSSSVGLGDAGRAADGVWKYTMFGAALDGMGLSEPITGSDASNAQRKLMGNLMMAGFIVAGSIDAFFGLVIDALVKLNPFRLFFDAVRENSSTSYDIASGGAEGPLQGLSDFINTLYTGLLKLGWLGTIPIFIGVFALGVFMFRRFDNGSNFKKLVVRIFFLALGFTLLGSTYTATLESFQGTNGNSRDMNANKVVTSTYLDYEAWVMNTRMQIPQSANIYWDPDKDAVGPRAVADIRRTTRLLNEVSNDNMQGQTGENGGVINVTGPEGFANKMFDETDKQNQSAPTTASFDAVWSMLNRYVDGDLITGQTFEQQVKAGFKQKAIEAGTTGEAAMEHQFTAYTDPQVMKKMKKEEIDQYAAAFVQGDGLTVSNSGSSTDGTADGYKMTSANSGHCNASEVADGVVDTDGGRFMPKTGCSLSPLTQFNLLNSDFNGKNMLVESSNISDSSYTRHGHASVSQIGNGAMGMLYWFSALSILLSFAVIGIFYALSMLFSNIKRSIQLIAAVPFATLGFMGGIAKVIVYTIAMILEIILTLFVYRVMQEFILAIPAVLEAPLVAAFGGEEGDRTFGLVFAAGSQLLANNIKVGSMLVLLVSTFGVIAFTFIAMKMRSSLISALDEAVTNTVNRFLDTNVGGGAPGQAGSMMRRQLMTAGAMGLGHRIATGGQADIDGVGDVDGPEAAATGRGGSAGDPDGNGGGTRVDPNGPGGVDDDGRFVASSFGTGAAGTALMGMGDDEAAAAVDEAGMEPTFTTAGYESAATGAADDGTYLDAEGNPVDMADGPQLAEDGSIVAPDGTPLTQDTDGNYVDDNGNVMYDAEGQPAGQLAENLAAQKDAALANGDVSNVSDKDLANGAIQNGGVSDLSKVALASNTAAGTAAGIAADQAAAMDPATMETVHSAGGMGEAAAVGEATGAELAAAGGMEIGDSGLYQMDDGSLIAASDSQVGEAVGADGTISQSPFTGEALAAQGGQEIGDSGVYQMPDGSTVAAYDSAASEAQRSFDANAIDDALASNGGAVGMSSMSSSELAAQGAQEITPGSGLFQTADGSTVAAADSALAAQAAGEGGAGQAVLSDMSASQLQRAGGEAVGDSGLYQMPDGSVMAAGDSAFAQQAQELGTASDIPVSNMTASALEGSGAQPIGDAGVYQMPDGQLTAAADSAAAASGAQVLSFGTTDGGQVVDAMNTQGIASAMNGGVVASRVNPVANTLDAVGGGDGAAGALSEALRAAPAGFEAMKQDLGVNAVSGSALANAGGMAAGGASMAAIAAAAAKYRQSGMSATEAFQAAAKDLNAGGGTQNVVPASHTTGGSTVANTGTGSGTGARDGDRTARAGMSIPAMMATSALVNKVTQPTTTNRTVNESVNGGSRGRRKARPDQPSAGAQAANAAMRGVMRGATGARGAAGMGINPLMMGMASRPGVQTPGTAQVGQDRTGRRADDERSTDPGARGATSHGDIGRIKNSGPGPAATGEVDV